MGCEIGRDQISRPLLTANAVWAPGIPSQWHQVLLEGRTNINSSLRMRTTLYGPRKTAATYTSTPIPLNVAGARGQHRYISG